MSDELIRWVVTRDYAALPHYGPWPAGYGIALSQADADWLNCDSPGVVVLETEYLAEKAQAAEAARAKAALEAAMEETMEETARSVPAAPEIIVEEPATVDAVPPVPLAPAAFVAGSTVRRRKR